MDKPHLTSGGRYPVLRTVAILYVFGAAAALIVGVCTCAWALFGAPYSLGDRFILALAAAAGTFFIPITLLAVAEVLKLFIDMEHNSRMAALGISSNAMNSGTTAPTAQPIAGGRLAEFEQETAEEALLRGH